jgi:hypothetical protein
MAISPDQYYKILGLEPDATMVQLKKAYRKKARLYHPDLNKRKDAAELFIVINEAYEYLEKYIDRKNGKDEAHEKLIREWEEYRRDEARKRAYRNARAKYSDFKKSQNYRASMVLNKAQLFINLSVAIFVIAMAVIAYIIKWKMVDQGYDPPTLASFIFLLSIGLICLLVSLAHLQEFYRNTRKTENNEKKD